MAEQAQCLAVAKSVMRGLGLSDPSDIITPTLTADQQLVQLMFETAYDVRSRGPWPAMKRTATITLVADQESYGLPDDFYSLLPDTFYDQTNRRTVIGPISDGNWNARKYLTVTSNTRRTYRITGIESSIFSVDPIPPESGDVISFDYLSSTTVAPRIWTASTAYSVGDYVTSLNRIYRCTTSGTSSTTPPSHSSGSASDGTVVWAVSTLINETIRTNTDFWIFEPYLMTVGTQYRLLRAGGQDYQSYQDEYERALALSRGRWNQEPNISMDQEREAYVARELAGDGSYGL